MVTVSSSVPVRFDWLQAESVRAKAMAQTMAVDLEFISKGLSAIDQNCDWAVVHEFHLHHFPKTTGGHIRNTVPDLFHKQIIKWFSNFGRRRIAPRRPQTAAHIAIERKLRHDKHSTAGLCN